ncbi:MAG: 4Fe-4S binding protein [Candidatus Bathyarchaeota archaeon]|nr:4Fe-4S binding protein [Candidatus Bathyarchaeota archaeon]
MVALLSEMLKILFLAGLTLAGTLAIRILAKNLSRKTSYLRIFIQIMSQAFLFYLIAFPLWLSLVVVVLLLATLFFGRFFCGWICPFGFYMDLVSMLRQTLKVRYLSLPESVNRFLHELRYLLFGVLLVWPLFLVNYSNLPNSSSVIFLSGPFNPLRILLAPLVPVIAPWQIFPNSNLNFPYVDQIVYYSNDNYALMAVLVFVGLAVVSSFLVRRFWCRFCPTGVSLAIANKLSAFKWAPVLHIEKDGEKCTKCGICRRVCTAQDTSVYEQKGGRIDSSMCMLCLRCVEMCPCEECLKVKFDGKTLLVSKNWLEPATEKL